MKKVIGETSITTTADCPNCNYQHDLNDYCDFDEGEQYGNVVMNLEIKCEACKEYFIVEKCEY